jgi:hypothetical protein
MDETDAAHVIKRTHFDNAKFVIEQIRELGLKPHPRSRLMQMLRLLNCTYIPFHHPDFAIALEAQRDLQFLGFVFDQIKATRDNAKLKQLTRLALGDSVLPQHDKRESAGRDAQFELYLAALCCKSGMMPVDFAEPDVTCAVGGKSFGIAVKRIKSKKQVLARIKKAALQIEKAGYPGVIALDLSLAWNPDNQPVVSRFHSEMYPRVSGLLGQQFFAKNMKDIAPLVVHKRVIAIVAFNSRIRLRPNNQWGLDVTMTWAETPCREQDVEDFDAFHAAFLGQMPNVKRLE